jgi:hypothetical protein
MSSEENELAAPAGTPILLSEFSVLGSSIITAPEPKIRANLGQLLTASRTLARVDERFPKTRRLRRYSAPRAGGYLGNFSTVTETNWAGVTIKWNDRGEQATGTDMRRRRTASRWFAHRPGIRFR